MDTSTMTSYHEYNNHSDNFVSAGFVFGSGDKLITPLNSSTKPMTNSVEFESSFHSNAYDEDFVVNDEEDVTTPRSSPTLKELHRLLAASGDVRVSLNSSGAPDVNSRRCKPRITCAKKALSDVALKPCQYPLDRLFDESTPAISHRWIKDSIKRTADICSLIDKVPISPRSFASHPNVRPLTDISACNPAHFPKLMTCSSNGYLLGRLGELPFQTDLLSEPPFNYKAQFQVETNENSTSINGDASHTPPPAIMENNKSCETPYGVDCIEADCSSSVDVNFPSIQISQADSCSPDAPVPNFHSGTTFSEAEASSTTSGSSRSRRLSKKKRSKCSAKSNSAVLFKTQHTVSTISVDSSTECKSPPPSVDVPAHEERLLNSPEQLPESKQSSENDAESTVAKSPNCRISHNLTIKEPVAMQLGDNATLIDEDFTLVVNKKNRRRQKRSPVGSGPEKFVNAPTCHVYPAVSVNGHPPASGHTCSGSKFQPPLRPHHFHAHARPRPSNSIRSTTALDNCGRSPVGTTCNSGSSMSTDYFHPPVPVRESNREYALQSSPPMKTVHDRSINSSFPHTVTQSPSSLSSSRVSSGSVAAFRSRSTEQSVQHQRLKDFLTATWNSFRANSIDV